MDNKIAKLILSKLTSIEADIAILKQQNCDTQKNFNTLEQKFNNLEQKTDTMQGQFNTMEIKLDKLQTDFDDFKVSTENRLTSLEKTVAKIEYEHGDKLAVLLDYATANEEQHKELKDSIDNINNVLFNHSARISTLELKSK